MNIKQQSNNTALESYDSKSEKTMQSQNGFDDLGIAPSLLKAINRLKFEKPTPIQEEAIPVAIQGEDVIALAQTGSGKTLAFGIPLLQRLSKSKKGTGLILVPTRELAIQVDESLQTIARPLGIRSAVLIGGASMVLQRNILKKNPRIIIGTPGRLMDHLERGTLNLSKVEVFILDEADRMLDMGFVPDIKKIMESVPDDRQTMLFSATMPKPIEKIASQLMGNPVRIETDRSGATPDKVSQQIYLLKNQDKGRLLASHIKECTGPVLVFTRTKRMASKLSSKILDMGFASAEIHSDRSLGQRRNALEGFKRGKYQVLIATDIAARGIDVKGIELVVNYDMAANAEDHVHRIGRTGRAGKKGHAISFATSAQKSEIRDLERFMKMKLSVSRLPDSLPSEREFLSDGAHLNLREVLAPSSGRSSGRRSSSKQRPAKRSEFNRSEPRRSSSNRSESRPDRSKSNYSRDDKPARGSYSRDDKPTRGSYSRAASSDRGDFKKRPPKDFSNNRFGSKPRKFDDNRSSEENSSNRRYSTERTSSRREFFNSDAKKSSKYRFDSKPRDNKSESETVDRSAKMKYVKDKAERSDNFKKSSSSRSKSFFSKSSDSRKSNFKRKDSNNDTYNQSSESLVKSSGSFLNDSSSDNPFWSKFAGKKQNKKKSVGQGSGRKKRTNKK